MVLGSGRDLHVGYDEVAIWDHVVTAEEAHSVYEYYYKSECPVQCSLTTVGLTSMFYAKHKKTLRCTP